MAQALTASTWAACFPPGSARHRRATTRLRQPKRPAAAEAERSRRRAAPARRDKGLLDGGNQLQGIALDPEQAVDARHVAVLLELRSEERRVGKGGASKFNFRWLQYQ